MGIPGEAGPVGAQGDQGVVGEPGDKVSERGKKSRMLICVPMLLRI